jgi:pheromone shutdown-related protein TraB
MTGPVGSSTNNVTVVRRRRDGDGEERLIHIVATAHVSKKSIEEVRAVIREIKPDTVCVELDRMRYDALTDDTHWRKLDLFAILRERRTLSLLASLTLQGYQKRIGERLGTRPGAELLAAVETAREVGAEVVLADRDVQVTLRRTWANLGWFSKVKVVAGLVAGLSDIEEITEAQVEALKNREHMSDMLSEFARAVPEVKKPLIDERDAYMMSMIEEAPGRVLIAVVGSGHVAGMTEWAGKVVDRDALTSIPPPSIASRVVEWLVPAVALTAFYYGYRDQGTEGLLRMVQAWALATGVGTALFTVAAGAKPLSVLTAAVVSPVLSLVPTVSIGSVIGFVEAKRRKPTLQDAEKLGREVTTLKAMYKNSFSRVLLVATAAIVGSAIGAYAGAVWLLTLLE